MIHSGVANTIPSAYPIQKPVSSLLNRLTVSWLNPVVVFRQVGSLVCRIYQFVVRWLFARWSHSKTKKIARACCLQGKACESRKEIHAALQHYLEAAKLGDSTDFNRLSGKLKPSRILECNNEVAQAALSWRMDLAKQGDLDSVDFVLQILSSPQFVYQAGEWSGSSLVVDPHQRFKLAEGWRQIRKDLVGYLTQSASIVKSEFCYSLANRFFHGKDCDEEAGISYEAGLTKDVHRGFALLREASFMGHEQAFAQLETLVLSAKKDKALYDWLKVNGYTEIVEFLQQKDFTKNLKSALQDKDSAACFQLGEILSNPVLVNQEVTSASEIGSQSMRICQETAKNFYHAAEELAIEKRDWEVLQALLAKGRPLSKQVRLGLLVYQILKERKKPEYLQALQISYDAQLKLCQKNPASKEQEQSLTKLGGRLYNANKLEKEMSKLQKAFEKWAPSDDNDNCDGVSWSVFSEEAEKILRANVFSDNHRVKCSQLMQEAS